MDRMRVRIEVVGVVPIRREGDALRAVLANQDSPVGDFAGLPVFISTFIILVGAELFPRRVHL